MDNNKEGVETRGVHGEGWGGGECWGEKAENCTWTTIKKAEVKNSKHFIMWSKIKTDYV